MKILIYATPLYSRPLTGIGYYAQSLMSGLSADPRVNVSGYVYYLSTIEAAKIGIPKNVVQVSVNYES